MNCCARHAPRVAGITLLNWRVNLALAVANGMMLAAFAVAVRW